MEEKKSKKVFECSDGIKNNLELNIIKISLIIEKLKTEKDFSKEIKFLKEIEKSFYSDFGIKLSDKEKNLIKKYFK